MLVDSLNNLLDFIKGWPLILYVMSIACLYTIMLRVIQIRRFADAWKLTLFPPKSQGEVGKQGQATPIQAFINTLSSSVGNGSLAGMATAVNMGGPGAAFWVLVCGIIMMAVRFAEVYVSVYFSNRAPRNQMLGGPMLYLKLVPGGNVLAYIYAACCLSMGLALGAGMQANSIAVSVADTWHIQPVVTGAVIVAFVLYVLLGGSERVSKVTGKLVPLNLAIFFTGSISLLIAHRAVLAGALSLIWKSAFTPVAPVGALAGFAVQQAIRLGMTRSVMATESGLGSAAILFGFMDSKQAMKNALMSMLTTFISTGVCFMVALCIVVSGAWQTGLNGTALTGAAFKTVFCSWGGLIVSFLSIGFGMSVMTAYAYIMRITWLFLTGGRWVAVFMALYVGFAAVGSVAKIDLIWNASDIPVALMLFINLFGLLYLLPVVVRNVYADEAAGK